MNAATSCTITTGIAITDATTTTSRTITTGGNAPPSEYTRHVALSRSSHTRLQAWAIRAVAGFLVVYLLGAFGVPTLIPYLAVIIAVAIDGVRCARQREPARPREHTRTERGETIH